MLAQSVSQQYHMAGVRTEETKAEFEGLSRAGAVFFFLFSPVFLKPHHNLLLKYTNQSKKLNLFYLSTE